MEGELGERGCRFGEKHVSAPLMLEVDTTREEPPGTSTGRSVEQAKLCLIEERSVVVAFEDVGLQLRKCFGK